MTTHDYVKSLFIFIAAAYSVAAVFTKNKDKRDDYRYLALWFAIWGWGAL